MWMQTAQTLFHSMTSLPVQSFHHHDTRLPSITSSTTEQELMLMLVLTLLIRVRECGGGASEHTITSSTGAVVSQKRGGATGCSWPLERVYILPLSGRSPPVKQISWHHHDIITSSSLSHHPSPSSPCACLFWNRQVVRRFVSATRRCPDFGSSLHKEPAGGRSYQGRALLHPHWPAGSGGYSHRYSHTSDPCVSDDWCVCSHPDQEMDACLQLRQFGWNLVPWSRTASQRTTGELPRLDQSIGDRQQLQHLRTNQSIRDRSRDTTSFIISVN